MIRKLRRRFIATAMLAVMLVLLCLISIINVVDYRTITNRADVLLDLLVENNGTFPDFPGKPLGNGAALKEKEDTIPWNGPDQMSAETPKSSVMW